MSSVSLPISRLINVEVILAPQAAQGQNLSSLLILGESAVIPISQRMRSYTSIAQVAADFGTSAPEYLAAVLWFEQSPQPIQLFIGRWAKTATSGQLLGGPLTPTQQLIATWNAITDGGLTITIDGGGPENITGINFSGASNMNGVAALIDAPLTGATIVWNAIYNRFEVTSATTGATSTVSFASAPTGGGVTDVSGMLELKSNSSGAFQSGGIAAESALTAVTIFDNNFGQQWYALTILGSVDADSEAVAPYIEASNNKHFFGVTTQEAAVLTPGDTTDIAYILQQLGLNKTAVQYSSSNPYAIVSMFGRILTTDYAGNDTVITLMYKQEPGIAAETLTETQIDALEAKNCNVFVAYNNDTAIIERGTCASGNFIDEVMGIDALAIEIMTALYNVLYLSANKIPQTDAGTHILTTAIAQVCQSFVANGFLAPGTWTAQGFGSLQTGQVIPSGFYIYAPPVATQSQASRAKRISVPIQVACKLAGAVQTVDCSITVNS